MTRYLGLTEEELSENERMWREEQGDAAGTMQNSAGLRSVGISPGNITGDLETAAAAIPGSELGGDDLGAAPAASPVPLGGATPGAAPA
jgi:hypothetical protein